MANSKQAGKSAVVIKFKQGETLSKALVSAMKQLRDRDYVATLRERDATPIYRVAIAFEGKRVELAIKTWPLKTRAAKTRTKKLVQKKMRTTK